MEVFFKINPRPEDLAGTVKTRLLNARRAGMTSAVTGLEARAVVNAPVRTSNLVNARTTEVSDDGLRGIIRFTAMYARYVHEGTGLYGPHKTKIIPKAKKFLYWPGAAHPVKSVRGMKGRQFLARAAKETDIVRLYRIGMQDYLGGTK